MTKLNDTAKATLRDAGVTQAAWFRANGYDAGSWGGDACGCPDDRCANGFHHDGPDDCGCLPALLADPPSWLKLPGKDQGTEGEKTDG